MADCERLPGCPFFHDKMENMPVMADMYKHRYCQGDNSECARWLVLQALGSGNVPGDLFPNDVARAEKMIREAQPVG